MSLKEQQKVLYYRAIGYLNREDMSRVKYINKIIIFILLSSIPFSAFATNMCSKTHYWKLANKHSSNAGKSIKETIHLDNELRDIYNRHSESASDFLEQTELRVESYEKIAYAKRQSNHAKKKFQRILNDCENVYSANNKAALRSNIRKANMGVEITSKQYQEASSIENTLKERIIKILKSRKIIDKKYLASYQLLIDIEYLSLGKIYSQGQKNVFSNRLKRQNKTGDYNHIIQFINDHAPR